MRWITGFIMAAVVIALLRFGPEKAVLGVIILICAAAMREYFAMTHRHLPKLFQWAGVLFATSGAAFLAFVPEAPLFIPGLLFLSLVFSFTLHFTVGGEFPARIRDMALFHFGVIYGSVLFSFLAWVRLLPRWEFWVFIMLASTVLSDMGGYVIGKKWGKRKLAPDLSPKKTVEGLVGGVLFAVAGSFIVRALFWPEFPPLPLMGIALLISLCGPVGDLSQSFIKRGCGVKDSGSIIPGHGGIWDRIDALLFAAPVTYYVAQLF